MGDDLMAILNATDAFGVAGEKIEYILRRHREREGLPPSSKIPPITSVLLWGRTGSGKGLLVRQLCAQLEIDLVVLEPSMVFLQADRQTATQVVREHFQLASLRASSHRPLVLLLERANELVPRETEDEALPLECALWMRHFQQCHGPLVIVSTDGGGEALHVLWKEHVDLQIEMPPLPKYAQREAILAFFLHSNTTISWREQDGHNHLLKMAASHSAGFAVCDLAELAWQMSRASSRDPITSAALCTLLERLRPMVLPFGSTALSRLVDYEPVGWEQIHGQQEAKRQLQQAASYLTDPAVQRLYEERGLVAPRGILLCGPPGTGKTLLARALATQCHAHFISVSTPAVLHAELGQSEKSIRAIFDEALRMQPSIIFFDEIDALVSRADSSTPAAKMAIQLGEEMDRLNALVTLPSSSPIIMDGQQRVLLLAATNLLASVDPGLRRYGRFDCPIYIGPLSIAEQMSMLESLLADCSLVHSPIRDKILLQMECTGRLRTGAQLVALADRIKQALPNQPQQADLPLQESTIAILQEAFDAENEQFN